jgi:hypothetical protein
MYQYSKLNVVIDLFLSLKNLHLYSNIILAVNLYFNLLLDFQYDSYLRNHIFENSLYFIIKGR